MSLVNSKNNNDVAKFVFEQFSINRNHRNTINVDDQMRENKRMMRGELSCGEKEAFGDNSPRRNIVQEKGLDFEAAFSDIEFNIWDKPWILRPTPKPNIPTSAKIEIARRIMIELQQIRDAGPVSREQLIEIARTYKNEVQGYVKADAERGIERMDRQIYDQLSESNWVDVYSSFIRDLEVYPTAFIKGPLNTVNKNIVWAGDTPLTDHTINPTVHRVSSTFIFPSPDSTNTQDGQNIIEIFPVSTKELTLALKLEGFNKTQIRAILGELENGNYEWWKRSGNEDVDLSLVGTLASGYTYGIKMYGTYSGRELKAKSMTNKIKNDEIYNIEIWQVGEHVIRGIVIDEPDYSRPIHGTSYRKIPGQFWGKSIACLLKDNQLSVNAFLRLHQDAAKNAAKPFKGLNSTRFSDDDIEKIIEYGIEAGEEYFYEQDPYGSNERAVEFFNFRDASQSILLSLQWYIRQGHEITGLQPQLVGASDLSSVNRTASVFVQSANNSLKKIKLVAKNIDEDVVNKIIQQYYKKNMLYSNDSSIKYDAQVITKGSAGIVEQEVMSNQFGFILQNIAQLISLRVPGAQELYTIFSRRYLKHLGVDAGDWIPDHEKQKELAAAGADVRQLQSPEQGTAPAQLDGRNIVQDNTQFGGTQ